MALLPKPNIADTLVNNFSAAGAFWKLQPIPSIKIDHNFSDKAKISGYLSQENTDKSNGIDGLPEPISQVRDQDIHSKTFRVNYDHSLTPTLLLHLGAGVQRYYNPDTVPPESADYDNKQLGNLNAPGSGFPRFGGGSLGGNTYGGMAPPSVPATAASTCKSSRPAWRRSPGYTATTLTRPAASGRSIPSPISVTSV